MSDDQAPGEKDAKTVGGALLTYGIGFTLAALLTAASFLLPMAGVVWAPALPVALLALAAGQMGVHLVFFLHITSGPDNANNLLALAFGVLIVALVLVGSIWIILHLDHAMMPMEMLERMQR